MWAWLLALLVLWAGIDVLTLGLVRIGVLADE
jgi:hypothetical protein